jgi:hypothetical protein
MFLDCAQYQSSIICHICSRFLARMAFNAREECITACLLTSVGPQFIKDRNVGFGVDGVWESESEKDPLVFPSPDHLQAVGLDMSNHSSRVARLRSDD